MNGTPLVYIHRDPFARRSTVRVRKTGAECAWCEHPARFHYGFVSDDSGRPSFDLNARGEPVTFCSRDCRRAFFGE